jgi:hypothetical protein
VPHRILKEEKPAALPVHVREVMLDWAFNAAMTSKAAAGSDPDAVDSGNEKMVDMIYHSRIYVQDDETEDEMTNGINGDHNSSASDYSEDDSEDDEMDNLALLQTFQQLLDDEQLSPVNLIYVSIQGVLIYDAHRGGLLHSDATERYLLYGEAFDADFGKPAVNENDDLYKCLHEQLTHHILDDILSFLNDESTGVLPQVCRAWRDEVGTRSPQLWKMLLSRRNWLSTLKFDENDSLDADDVAIEDGQDINGCQLYRDAFISHYLAVRDVRAISNACNFLQSGGGGGRTNSNTKQKDGIEYAVQSFKATKGSPVFDNSNDKGRCVVKVWPSSKTPRALAAYSTDCTLRLFEAIQGSSSSKMICRQIVCVRASPPSVSRKKNKCELVSMDLDDCVVASLVTEVNDSLEVEIDTDEVDSRITPWITVIPCEELVCSGNEGILSDDCIHSFDLRASVLDYIIGGDHHGITELRDGVHQYLSVVDSDTSDVLILVTPKLVACGKGNFLFHASISIPGYSLISPLRDDESVDSEVDMHPASIVFPFTEDRLFVISTQRGGAIVHSIQLMNGCDGLFASIPFLQDSAMCTNVVIRSGNLLKLKQLTRKRDGTFDSGGLNSDLPEDVEEDVCIDVTSSHVIYETRSNGSVVNIFEIASRDLFRTTPVQDALLQNVHNIQGHYVMAIYRTQTAVAEEGDEAFEGHWFGHDISMRAFVYHIPSRHLLQEFPMPSLHLSLDTKGDILAINSSTLGFIIAGASVREVSRRAEDEDRVNDDSVMSPNGKNPKGKKKRLAAKTAKKDKKDGFARGMSMRG